MTIDQIGIVVPGIDAASDYYVRTFGLRKIGGAIKDALQDVELQFLEDDRGQRIELIQPASDASPAARALKTGGGFNHICYRVDDLDATIHTLLAEGAKLVREPMPAVAFDGRRVSFLYTRQRELIELVETGRR